MPTISFFGLIGKNNELITDSRRTGIFFGKGPSPVRARVTNSLFIEITLFSINLQKRIWSKKLSI